MTYLDVWYLLILLESLISDKQSKLSLLDSLSKIEFACCDINPCSAHSSIASHNPI